MKRIALAALVASALSTAAFAAPETFTIDSGHTYPSFEIGHFGYSIQRGRFNKTSGKITLNAAAKKGMVDITIDAASISTGNEKLEAHLKGEDFFNVARFPTLTFKSAGFTMDGDTVKMVPGELTILGVTKPVTLTASQFKCADHPMARKKACGGEFTAKINRTDFGMKYAVPNVADEVTLRINVEALKD
ncbi:MAG: polyisoprenoid-binding protein [Betaproteobacteria bacterium]|nr:polyisoprenoid-binding protein [Betaproteobacteria bacterium]